MPEPYYKARPYPGQVYQLRHAAAAGQLVVIRCNLCRRGATYLATDLAALLGRYRDALWPPSPARGAARTST
jgi:hypothetical protein